MRTIRPVLAAAILMWSTWLRGQEPTRSQPAVQGEWARENPR